MRAYGGDEDFDAMMLDAIPVVLVPDEGVSGEDEVGAFSIPGFGTLTSGGQAPPSGGFLSTWAPGGTDVTSPGGAPTLSTGSPFAGGSQATIPGMDVATTALGAAQGILGAITAPGPTGPNYAGTGSKGPAAFETAMRGGSGIAPPPTGGGFRATWAPGGTTPAPRSNSGLELRPGPDARTAAVPGAMVEPLVAPITFDKLEKIRELAEMVRDGSVRRVRTIVRQGGALGRLARELLRT
jgi:hypothetical protein